jgi:hypothetical protein
MSACADGHLHIAQWLCSAHGLEPNAVAEVHKIVNTRIFPESSSPLFLLLPAGEKYSGWRLQLSQCLSIRQCGANQVAG